MMTAKRSVGMAMGCLAVLLAIAARPTVAAGQSIQPVAVVPFQFLKQEIVAQVRVNGHGPYAMLLDTGTAPSVVDLKLARQLGLKIDSSGHEGSGGGTSAAANLAYETTLPEVEINGLKAANVSALAMDLSGLSKKFGTPLQGVLGDSLFSGRVVQFDYPHRTARFYAHSPFTAASPRMQRGNLTITLPFRHTDEVHLSGVRVNGQAVAANLDTGSNSEFQLTPRAVRRLGLTQAAAKAAVKSQAGFNGAYDSRIGTLASVQVGAIRVASPPVTFWQAGTGHDDRPWDINIGNLFWQHYIVTIDYQRDAVTLQGPAAP